MKPYYVALTGSKNNAGDFLIKHRAAELFSALRPDRDLVDLDGWRPLDAAALDRINGAQALLLLGGPALQPDMVPGVYPLAPRLDDIRVPMIAVGIGWKHRQGSWQDTHRVRFGEPTRRLLARMVATGLPGSVRDFHSLNVLAANGFDGFVMSGCPATYDLPRMASPEPLPDRIGRIAFSLGVCFVRSTRMAAQAREMVLRLRERFAGAAFDVAFHHSLDRAVFDKAYPDSGLHLDRHLAMAEWLGRERIGFTDISGSASQLVDYYAGVDLHVGYRVHAHIFMASRAKPSLLIAEDGRGRAVRDTLGGLVVDAASRVHDSRIRRVAGRYLPALDPYVPNPAAWTDLRAMLDYEQASGWQRTRATRALVGENFGAMRSFLARLP